MEQKSCVREIVSRPAIMPLEAAVIPAREKRRYGALSMTLYALEAICRRENQRAKI